MKQTIKWIGIAAALVLLLVGASVLYARLGEEYGGGDLIVNTETDPPESGTEGQPTETESEPAESETESAESETEETVATVPDFTVLDRNGNAVRLSDYFGKPIVLNFWATWCYYCKQEMPDFNRAYEAYPDVQFLMVNATDGVKETVASATAYVEKEGFDFEIFFDTEGLARSAYYVNAYPITFFINAKGELVAYKSGMMNYATLEKGIGAIAE